MSKADNDARYELGRARGIASSAVAELRNLKDRALERRDYEAYDRFSAAYSSAIDVEDKATQRLIAGLLNPVGKDIQTLGQATDQLNERLERLRQSESTLNDLATALTILQHAILLFAMA